MKRTALSILTVIVITALSCQKAAVVDKPVGKYPVTPRIPVSNVYHNTEIVDNYRWLEDGEDPDVQKWVEEQEALTKSILDPLPQKAFLVKRFNELWRYDDESVPDVVLNGDRLFYWTKQKDDEKWVYNTKAREGAEPVVLLNPNQWDAAETIGGINPSRDGKYLAYGIAHGGDENPITNVMVVDSKEILPDKLLGWKQNVSSWMPDNSGFYYNCKPLKDDVPEGEENYWHAAYYHKLGTPASEDKKVFYHDEVKEYWHSVSISEDGKYEIYDRSLFNKNEEYFRRTGSDKPLITLAAGFDGQYIIDFVDDKILIRTDKDAPLYMVYITDTDKPERENWKVFIPQHEKDRLDYIASIAGHIYAVYQHNAYTQIKIYNLEGEYIRDLPLPTIGSAYVSGYWSKPDVWVSFSSFTYPSTTFKYDFAKNELIVYKEFPIEIDVDNMTAEQVWYKSKDGTPVSMFLIHRKDLVKNGDNPTLLTGYGGFNISIKPYFSTSKVVWLEAGGMIAMPNLRGGGEYGRDWHEAGMREKKQNVFDDFIAAAQWLIDNKYTNPEKLAIQGGSNGGLLVGAAVVQRPEMFKAVLCIVPLLDMVNYHNFGLANIWSEEYGSSEDPEQFKYLRKYSPYHNVKNRVKYPAMLITGSENDARVDPLHARKMVARMQEADPKGEPILLLQRKASGHGGGTTLSMQIDQTAETLAFLMYELGMEAPER